MRIRPAHGACSGDLLCKVSGQHSNQSGIAMVTAIFLTLIMSVLGLIMVVTVNSDMLINGYYGSYRSAFYAADAGLNIARQQLMLQLTQSVNMNPCTSWGAGAGAGCTSTPLPTGAANMTTWMSNMMGQYSSFMAVQNGGNWREYFEVGNYSGCTNQFPSTFNGVSNPVQMVTTSPATGLPVDSFTYYYQLCVVGKGAGTQISHTSETGSFTIAVGAQSAANKTVLESFSAFGAFIDNFSNCLGPLVPGTITGPQFTNGAWNFGSGSYIFTDPVGQSNAQASYWFNNNCYNAAAPSYSHNSQTIAPTFQAGFNLSQAAVPLPANDFSQAYAVLDGMGCGALEGTTCGSGTPATSPTNAQMNTYLKDVNGNAYPSGGTSSGVFLSYDSSGTMQGGGIYVQGNVTSVEMQPGSSNGIEIYTIVQGGTTTTITTNISANTTTIVSGGTTKTVSGVPQNKITGTPSAATMLYVNGNVGTSSGTITGLSGPGEGQVGIGNGVQATVVAHGSLTVSGDLIYATEPVTLNTSDTLVTSPSIPTQVLGLFTQTGNLVLNSNYGDNNLEVDASMAAIGAGCSSSYCGLSTPGNGINTLTVVGGRIEGNAHSVTIKTGNTYFDRRFTAVPGFSPPWFPSTTVSLGDIAVAATPAVTPTVQRLAWSTSPQ
jgi:Tfp pilus assembly protein PilX